MKRRSNLYRKLYTYENLCLAFYKAAKGKQGRRDVIAYRGNFHFNIQKLCNELVEQQPDIGHYRFFMVHDPKQRAICAASFPERVLHHAIMNICEPALETYAIYDSYACRKGKGNKKAVLRAQLFSRKYPWFLKLDICKYFDSIDHKCMMGLLERRFKDTRVLLLFQKLLATYNTSPGKGMPIGNLISQHLANLYLGQFDHWVKEELKVKGYIRYMDDFLIFGEKRKVLAERLERVKTYLERDLKLELNNNVQLNRCRHGIPFLGYRVFPWMIRLSTESRKRFVDKFRAYEQKRINGDWSEAELARHMEPLVDFTRFAKAESFRQKIINWYGVVS